MAFWPCDRCTMKMVLRETGKVLSYNEPVKGKTKTVTLEQEWWCGCGYRRLTEPIVRKSVHQPTTRELWEELNGISD